MDRKGGTKEGFRAEIYHPPDIRSDFRPGYTATQTFNHRLTLTVVGATGR